MNTDMKKIFKLMSTAIAAIAFNACSDVPAPYEIKDNGTGGDTSTYISESFSNGFGSFSVKTVKGIDWVIDYSTAKASGYNNSDKTNTASDSYLVSKTIDLSASTGAYLEFEYILRYASSGTNKVLITDSYTNDPATTNWTDITGKLTEGSDWTTFEKYSVNIPAEFIGKNAVNIAFHYTATDANSATWEVKNVKLKEGQAEVVPDTPDVPGDEGTGEGTVKSPYNVAKAQNLIATGKYTSDKVYVSGIISEIRGIDTSYGNAEYFISDDGTATNQLLVYRGYSLGGNKFTSTDEIKAGDKVIVYGVLTMFYSTPEFTTGSQIYSLNGKTGEGQGGGGDEPSPAGNGTVTKSGTTVTMSNQNATASTTTVTCDLNTYGWGNATEPAKVTLSDGTTIVFAQEGGNNAPKFYTATKGVRMYALNSMTVTGYKAIASIVIECDSYNGTDYIGNDELYVAINGNTWKMVNHYTQNSGGTQVRVKTVKITYAQ